MRKLFLIAGLIALTACNQTGNRPGGGTSPSAPVSGSASASPAGSTSIKLTGAATDSFNGTPVCIVSTSIVGSERMQTLILTALRDGAGDQLYFSLYPFKGGGKYTSFAKTKGSQVNVQSPTTAKTQHSWSAKSGEVVVSITDKDARGTMEMDLTAGNGQAVHLSGPWACAVQRPSPPSAPSPSPSK